MSYETVELEIQEFEIDIPEPEVAVEIEAEMELELEMEVAQLEETVDEQPTEEETTEPIANLRNPLWSQKIVGSKKR